MLNNELHLFVLEGAGAEPQFVKKLEQNFFKRKISVKCVFDAEIYQLYKQLEKEDFAVDIVNVLKERNAHNAETLKEYNRESFAGVYLFFDYDAHSTLADDDQISKMLAFFDNETENGYLYLSYPMVEAIRHFRDMDSFKDLVAKCKRGKSFNDMKCPNKSTCKDLHTCLKEDHYKNISAREGNINKYTFEVWKTLIRANAFKLNYLVNDEYCMPDSFISQKQIFEKQLSKHIIQPCPKVAVLSAFPLYVLDYYGIDRIKEQLNVSTTQ
ncbi:MAG: hypothetical protein KBS47_01985 [Bacteroidales bacterium]|nr:hypothetical protein [Candidatus Equimonas enterica]